MLKVKLKVPFSLIDPLSNIPLLLVTVCGTASLFVKVIEVTAATVMIEGLNAIPSIKTSFETAPDPVKIFYSCL